MNKGRRFKASGVVFHFLLSTKPLIGFAVNKRLGNAVIRNRFKRRCRSLFFSKNFSTPLHLVVQPVVPLEKILHLPGCFKKLYESIDVS
tara:strand:+ start:320 stop:586 length:267 start_codon:yes stop_codon:yes gene_type:complete